MFNFFDNKDNKMGLKDPETNFNPPLSLLKSAITHSFQRDWSKSQDNLCGMHRCMQIA